MEMSNICTYLDFVEKIEKRTVSENYEIYKSLNLNGESDYDNFTLALAYFVQRKRNLFDFFVEFCKSTEDNYLIESVVRQWVRHLGQDLKVDSEFHDNHIRFIGHLYNKHLITNRLLQTEVIGRLACVRLIKVHLLVELLNVIHPKLLIQTDIDFSFIAYLKLIVDDNEFIFPECKYKQLMLRKEVSCVLPIYAHLLPNDNTILTQLKSLFEDITSENYRMIFDRLKPIKYKNLIILKELLNLVVPFLKTRPKNILLYAKLIANFVQINVLELGLNFRDEAKVSVYLMSRCLDIIRVRYFPSYDGIFAIFENCLKDLLHVIEYDVSLLIGLKCNEFQEYFEHENFGITDNLIQVAHAKQKNIDEFLANIGNLSVNNFQEIIKCKEIAEIDTNSDLSKMMLIIFQKVAKNKNLQAMYVEVLKKVQNHLKTDKLSLNISELLKKYPIFKNEIEFAKLLTPYGVVKHKYFEKMFFRANYHNTFCVAYKHFVYAEAHIIRYLIDKLTLEDGKDFQDSLTKYVLTNRNVVYLVSEMIKRVIRMRPDLVNRYIDLYSKFLKVCIRHDDHLFNNPVRNQSRMRDILDKLMSYSYANEYVVSAFIKKFRYLNIITYDQKENMLQSVRETNQGQRRFH